MFGEPVRDNPPLYARLGVMSEHETVYGFMKGRDFVRTMGKLRGVPDLERAVDRAVALVDLEEAQHRSMETYSRGMRQRMRLAATLQAMLHPRWAFDVGLQHGVQQGPRRQVQGQPAAARRVAKLGNDTGFLCPISRDGFGTHLAALLDMHGDTAGAKRMNDRARRATTKRVG